MKTSKTSKITWNKKEKCICCDARSNRPITVGEALDFLNRLPKDMPMFVCDDYDTPPLNLNCFSVVKADEYEFEPEDEMDGKEFCAVNG
jgi:hypothetical protein